MARFNAKTSFDPKFTAVWSTSCFRVQWHSNSQGKEVYLAYWHSNSQGTELSQNKQQNGSEENRGFFRHPVPKKAGCGAARRRRSRGFWWKKSKMPPWRHEGWFQASWLVNFPWAQKQRKKVETESVRKKNCQKKTCFSLLLLFNCSCCGFQNHYRVDKLLMIDFSFFQSYSTVMCWRSYPKILINTVFLFLSLSPSSYWVRFYFLFTWTG